MSDAAGAATSSMAPTMLASALTGAIVRIPCHPIDTVKARIMAESRSEFNNTSRTLLFRNLYRGFGITFLGSIPASCLYFSTYELSKQVIADWPMPTSMAHLLSGLVAEIVSCVLWVPIDVVKERMQVQKMDSTQPPGAYKYRNSYHAFRSIVKADGIVKGLYAGYGATVLSFGPYSALYFAFYEYLRSFAAMKFANQIPFPVFLFCGGCAGAGAAFITNSLDLVKLRMQTQNELRKLDGNGLRRYRNIFQGVVEVYREEGIAHGLFRGSIARVAFSAPSAALSIALFETLKAFFS